MSKRKTPQNEAFTCSKRLSIVENALAVLSCIYSCIHQLHTNNTFINFWGNVFFILLVFLVTLFKNNKFSIGTMQRIEFFLDDSFGRKRTAIDSKTYYDNNEIKTEMKRVLANIHENILYTKEITKVMLIFHITITFILGSVFLFVFRTFNDNVTLILLNFMLSGNFLSNTLSIYQLNKRCNELFAEADRICSQYKEIGEIFSAIESDIVGLFGKYESLIADTKVNLWEWVFNMKNKKLEKRWQKHKAFFEIYG